MTPRRSIFIFVAILSIGGGVLYAAQKSLKVDVDLVMVNVAVIDSDNRSVTDLKAENFHVFEDKVEQQIRYFASEAAPMSLGIVFDISHSMERKLDFAKDAAVKFLEKGTPDDVLNAKFHALTRRFLPAPARTELAAAIWRLETFERLDPIIDLMLI